MYGDLFVVQVRYGVTRTCKMDAEVQQVQGRLSSDVLVGFGICPTIDMDVYKMNMVK